MNELSIQRTAMIMEAGKPFVEKKPDDHWCATPTVLNYLKSAPPITSDLINRCFEVYELPASGALSKSPCKCDP